MKIMTSKEQRLDLRHPVDFKMARREKCKVCDLSPPSLACIDCMWNEYDSKISYPAVYQVIRIEFRGE